ncbi:MAG: hypothetical protein ACK5NG_02500 [Chthoniobacterales bacterium]
MSVDDVHYVFDPKIGLLISASRGNTPLVTGLRPTIWRKLDPNESAIGGSRRVRRSPDLNHYTPTATDWKVKETEDTVVITTIIDCVVDKKNRCTTTFRYTIDGKGALSVHYEIQPKVETPWVPVVGMVLTSPPNLDRLHWFGLGPLDAYPN